MESQFFKTFQQIVEFFETFELETKSQYMLVGGVLTPIYAESRQTQDIDLLIKIEDSLKLRSALEQKLKEKKFQPFTTWEDVFYDWKITHFIQFLSPNGDLKIDLNIVKKYDRITNNYDKIRQMAFSHRQRENIFNIECWVQSKEDFILSKLVYGGYQDYKDALACWIRFETDIDVNYITEQAKNLDIHRFWQAIKGRLPVDKVFTD